MTRLLTTAEELAAIEREWDTLAGPSGRPMQHHAWFSACAADPTRRLHVLVAGTPGRIGAIAPLAVRQNGTERLELVGDEIYEPVDLIYNDPQALLPLARELAQMGMPLHLKRVPAESPTPGVMREAYRRRGMVIARTVPGCPVISLHEGWLRPESQLESGRRSDLRRARRNAEKIGQVRSEILSPTPAEVEPCLAEAFRIEAAGWKGREGSALALDAGRRAFYRRYAMETARQGTLRICFLRIGGQAVAMQFAIEHGQGFWLLKIGYDEAFSRCSPGNLLIADTVRYAAARGLRAYEFLGSIAPWTKVWTVEERACLSVRAYPVAARGLAALAADAAAIAGRRIREAVLARHE